MYSPSCEFRKVGPVGALHAREGGREGRTLAQKENKIDLLLLLPAPLPNSFRERRSRGPSLRELASQSAKKIRPEWTTTPSPCPDQTSIC